MATLYTTNAGAEFVNNEVYQGGEGAYDYEPYAETNSASSVFQGDKIDIVGSLVGDGINSIIDQYAVNVVGLILGILLIGISVYALVLQQANPIGKVVSQIAKKT